MFHDTTTLIDEAVENLNLLAELFADEIDTLRKQDVQTPPLHRYREAYMTIAVLVPKLKAARELQQPAPMITRQPYCMNCD